MNYHVTGSIRLAHSKERMQEFARAMRLRFGWMLFLTRWPGLFVLLALVLAVGGARKIVLTRRRLAAMEDDDLPPPPVIPSSG